jgi:hypothetical protein
MAYGEGRTRLYRDIAQEEASEFGRYESELGKAEKASRQDIESSTLWQALFGTVGAAAGFALSGGNPYGAVKGWTLGKETGKWGQRATSGYDPEDYAISTDPGKFDVSQRYKFEDINRQFEDAARTRLYKDITGTGMSIASMLSLGAKGEGGLWDYSKTQRTLLPLGEETITYVDPLDQLIKFPDVREAVTE